MRVRATIKMRNDHLIAAREKLGLSQKAAWKASGVSFDTLCNLEKMNYKKVTPEQAQKLADFYELPREKVMPEGWEGVVIPSTVQRIQDVPSDRILSWGGTTDHLLSDPADQLLIEERNAILGRAMENLNRRERIVLQARIFDGLSLDDTGKAVGVTRERVRQIEIRALKRLRESQVLRSRLEIDNEREGVVRNEPRDRGRA